MTSNAIAKLRRYSAPHALFLLHIRAFKLEKPELEYRFHPKRRWRFDCCWPALKLAVEIHGGVFSRGRHNRALGFTADREKMNAAVEMGWAVLEYSTGMVESGEAIRQTARVLGRLEASKKCGEG